MNGCRILVVEDSATQREAARAALDGEGFEVQLVGSGEEALEQMRRRAVDLVLSDVVMPGMSGFELCARVKAEIPQPPPVVLLTSLSDPRDVVRGVECGADSYIRKPFDPAQLARRIREVLANARRRDSGGRDGPLQIEFLGESYQITSNPPQILALLLSSFEDLVRTNEALRESERRLAEAHARELHGEQDARERAEADARRMETLMERAEEASRARDDVLAMVSHDLRNPVGTIFTSASLLLEMDLPPEGVQRQLEIIRRTAGNMDRLIQDLLDVSRLEAGGFAVNARPEHALALVQEAYDLLASVAASRGIELASPSRAPDLYVRADRDRVRQVLSNLVGNALKFTPEGGRVSIGMEPEADSVRFVVADTGPGIPEEDIPRIFDRFWHGKGGGSGLGLAIAKGIVEAHGGRIWAESSADGCTFLFTLPRVEGQRRKV